MAFHAKEGFWVDRFEDGSVRVFRYSGAQDHDGFSFVFTPQEWASIVASVSREGETSVTWHDALNRQLP